MNINEILTFFVTDITLNLLVATLVIFALLALKSGSIKSFHFQIFVFVFIWIFGEALHVFGEAGFLPYPNLADMYPIIHVISMTLISLVFLLRYINVKRDKKKFLSNFENA